MSSHKLFQNIIAPMGEVCGRPVGVIDENACIIASSENSKIGTSMDFFSIELSDSRETFIRDGYTYKPFGNYERVDFAVYVEGTDNIAERYSEMIALSLVNLKLYHDEKYDRNNFIKNVIINNIIVTDINAKAREFHFNADATRVVFYIRVISKNDISVQKVIENLFPDKNKDFIFTNSETEIILVKEIKSEVSVKNLENMAFAIADTLSTEFFTTVNIGIGTPVNSIGKLSKSFNEAQDALKIGKIFDTEKNIISYDNLGIARLVYHVPPILCETFLREIFKKGSIDTLDKETLSTIQRFFENNLNVSETSRRLFVHRNTLVYRLDKIKKLTGLDLREFDHAIVFKIALIVKKYISSQSIEEQLKKQRGNTNN